MHVTALARQKNRGLPARIAAAHDDPSFIFAAPDFVASPP